MVKGDSIYLFIGEEEFLKQKAIEKIKSEVLNEGFEGFDYDLLHAKEVHGLNIINCLNTEPLMSKRRLVVIKNVDSLSDVYKKLLLSYAKNPNKNCLLILETPQSQLKGEFYGSLSKYTKVMNFPKPSDKQLYIWLIQQVCRRGKRIERTAVELLRENVGDDLQALWMGIEGIILFVGNRELITEADVEEVVGRSLLKGGFQLTEAIGEGKASEALMVLGDLFKAGKKPHQILGLLAWQWRRIWQAKELLLKGESRQRIAQALNIKTYFLDKLLNQVDSFSEERMEKGFQFLLEADKDIKTGRVRPDLSLELLSVRLCLS